MRNITLVMAYYMNAGMLRVHYDHWRSFPQQLRERIEIIVVDDGSPAGPAWGEEIGVDLSVYRMHVDVRWNQDACRNVGAHHAKHPWLLLTDMDHKLPIETLRYLVETADLKAGKVYRFSRVSEPELAPYKLHVNSWFLTREMYDHIGGYDERFAGIYGTDGDFATRVRMKAAGLVQLKQTLIRVPREVVSDASTTVFTRKTDADKAAFHRVINERRDVKNWRTVRRSFPYSKVY